LEGKKKSYAAEQEHQEKLREGIQKEKGDVAQPSTPLQDSYDVTQSLKCLLDESGVSPEEFKSFVRGALANEKNHDMPFCQRIASSLRAHGIEPTSGWRF
jgi:hypothetical protein